ncbi:unnamed protein product [Adineta steineri]|uniref:Uncharacterized protein n=1 Tax=Adineta steineri TaxID=433720 RepID=A0A815PUM8_9BILA|nr:unnamed protein product [Adineta steineri]CAF4094027.1 unnamed protein product [Adineta steineri]
MSTTNDTSLSSSSFSNDSPLVILLQHDTDGNLMEDDSVEPVLTRNDNINQSSNSSSNIITMNQQTITNQLPPLREQPSIYTVQVEPVPNSSTTKSSLISKYERDIPAYLMGTNCTFEQMIKKEQNHAIHSVNIHILREIALLLHRENIIYYEKSIWHTYLKCGTGTLKLGDGDGNNKYSLDSLKYWPKKLKSIIQSTKILEISETPFTNETYLNLVQTYLQQLKNRKQQYRTKILEITKKITNYYLVIEPIIQNFIQSQFYSLNVETRHRIQEIDRLCRSIFNYEHRKQEYILLTHYIGEKKHLLKVSDIIQDICLPVDIKIMENQNIRQQFLEQHRKSLDQYQNSISKSLLDLTKIDMLETKKLYDDALTNLQQNQRNLPLCQQFNSLVTKAIQAILSNITQNVQCTFQLKTYELFQKIPLNEIN